MLCARQDSLGWWINSSSITAWLFIVWSASLVPTCNLNQLAYSNIVLYHQNQWSMSALEHRICWYVTHWSIFRGFRLQCISPEIHENPYWYTNRRNLTKTLSPSLLQKYRTLSNTVCRLTRRDTKLYTDKVCQNCYKIPKVLGLDKLFQG